MQCNKSLFYYIARNDELNCSKIIRHGMGDQAESNST